MNNFFLNALNREYILTQVKEFLVKDFPRLQNAKDWQNEYYSCMVDIMYTNPYWGAASYFRNAEITWVATFKTVLGQALAKAVRAREMPNSLSHITFSEEKLFNLMVTAKEKTAKAVRENHTNREIGAQKIFEEILCREMYEYYEKCRSFYEKVDASAKTEMKATPQEVAQNAESGIKKNDEIPEKEEFSESQKDDIPKEDENTESEQKGINLKQALAGPWMNSITGLVFVVMPDIEK